MAQINRTPNPFPGVQYRTFWACLGVERGDSDCKIAKIDFRKSIFDFSEPETGRLGLLGLLGLEKLTFGTQLMQ